MFVACVIQARTSDGLLKRSHVSRPLYTGPGKIDSSNVSQFFLQVQLMSAVLPGYRSCSVCTADNPRSPTRAHPPLPPRIFFSPLTFSFFPCTSFHPFGALARSFPSPPHSLRTPPTAPSQSSFSSCAPAAAPTRTPDHTQPHSVQPPAPTPQSSSNASPSPPHRPSDASSFPPPHAPFRTRQRTEASETRLSSGVYTPRCKLYVRSNFFLYIHCVFDECLTVSTNSWSKICCYIRFARRVVNTCCKTPWRVKAAGTAAVGGCSQGPEDAQI